MAKHLWCIQKSDLFKTLSIDELAKIHLHFLTKNYDKNQVVFEPGNKDRVYIVQSGQVEMYQLTPTGKKIIIERLHPGSVFGDLGAESSIDMFVETINPSTICSLDKEKFFEIISNYPDLSAKFMKSLFNRLLNMGKRLSSLAADNAFQKVLKLLLSLGKQRQAEDYVVFTDKFTHEELSQMLGVSRQTVTTLINQMEKKGLISRSGKSICFQPAMLEELAE